jgi:hypothetical protein
MGTLHIASRAGVSNSNSFEGHILTKNEPTGRIKIKLGLCGSQQRVEGAFAAPKIVILAIF